ncbi:MAG: outer membrane protein transport protein [Sulfurospirillaceae bacterium]|nr:outer membrane protein transport protein [Sulfurospirillaceae bacterium]
MKKVVLLALSASLLLATNGDNLIGLGAKSRAMGGVGIAAFFGAENVLSNPALISQSKGTEINFGATLFMPDVKANGVKSSADKNVIPEVSLSQQINDNWTFGIGMFGSAGMGVDYRGNPSLMDARTNLLLMKFAPALSYHKDKFSFGFAPVMQYGSLDIAYNMHGMGGINQVGEGSSDNFGLGYELGAAYDITKDLKLGLVYKSKISMTYKHTLSVASAPFVTLGVFPGAFADDLEQPAEYGVGLSYNYGPFNISTDYKKIKWGSAKGYKDFGWKDQDVYAIGAKYEKDGTWYGIGYNHAKNPIPNLAGTNAVNTAMNLFNYLMFPATAENHYSIGAGTKISKNLSVDFDILYAPKVTVTTATTIGALKVEHTETSVAFSMRYDF